jgi:hypothetical protein
MDVIHAKVNVIHVILVMDVSIVKAAVLPASPVMDATQVVWRATLVINAKHNASLVIWVTLVSSAICVMVVTVIAIHARAAIHVMGVSANAMFVLAVMCVMVVVTPVSHAMVFVILVTAPVMLVTVLVCNANSHASLAIRVRYVTRVV